MKKLLVLFLATILCFGMTVSAFAAESAEESFVQSPEREEDVILVDSILPGVSGMLELIIKSYQNRNEALENYEDMLVEAFDAIAEATDLSTLVSNIAEQFGEAIENLAVSNLFVAYTVSKARVSATGEYVIEVKCADLDNFEGLLNYTNGEWSIVEGAVVNEDGNIEFTTDTLDVFAVVVSTESNVSEDISTPDTDSSADIDTPPTGDEFPWLIVILGIAAVIIIVVLISTGKKRR